MKIKAGWFRINPLQFLKFLDERRDDGLPRFKVWFRPDTEERPQFSRKFNWLTDVPEVWATEDV